MLYEVITLLGDAAKLLGAEFDTNTLYEKLYSLALTSDASCGGLMSYNYISGEHVTGFEEGRPMFVRQADSSLKLPEFMRTHLYSSCSSLKMGMQILTEKEGVALDSITGHGGFFKQAYAGQRIMSSVLDAPVTVMETAGEGGPWGMAVLACYMEKGGGMNLSDYLESKVFAKANRSTVEPDKRNNFV